MVSRPKLLRKGLQTHLTRFSAFDIQADETFCGMAYTAGSGPIGLNCAQCRWFFDKRARLGRCAEFARQKQGREGDRFPGYAKACKFFEQGEGT